MARPYKKLRGEMYAQDVDQATVARAIGRCEAYVSSRMCGKGSWAVEEAYKICDLLEIPHDQLHEFFPPAGGKVPGEPEKK